MKLIVNPHKIELIQEQAVNEKEIDISKCEFEFADEITNDYVKEAYFTLGDNTYKQVIVNNECSFPQEVLVKPATIELGVVAYLVDNNTEIKRYNPTPVYFKTDLGSLKTAQNSQPITPSEMEQYEQALQEGLNEVANVDIDASKVGDTATVTITNRNGESKSVQVKDGEKGDKGDTGATGATGATGPAGKDGVDGVSPIATVTKSGSTATITITDKNGTTTTTISDGADGADGANGRDGVIQYTAGDNITISENNVISATGGDLSNYYTKSETNSLVRDSGDAKIYEFKVSGNIAIGNNTSQINITDTNDKARMGEIITNGYKYGLTGINLRDKTVSSSYFMGFDTNLSTKPTTLYFQGFIFPTVNSTSAYHIMDAWIQVTGTWSGDVFTCTTLTINFTANNSGKGYITTWQNENAITPTNDYNPATKKYVDDAIANVGGSDVPFYSIEMQTNNLSDFENYTLGETDRTNLGNIITDAYSKGYTSICIFVSAKDYNQPSFLLTNSSRTTAWGDIQSKPTILQFYNLSTFNPFYPGAGLPLITTRVLTINLSWSGNTATIGSNTKIESIQTGILTTVNEGSYTPTSNYHPATKKYVDDTISNKIWIGTQTEYDNLSSYSNSTVYFIKES